VPSNPDGICSQEENGEQPSEEGVVRKNAGMPEIQKDRTLLDVLIFTAGNPPEGQQ